MTTPILQDNEPILGRSMLTTLLKPLHYLIAIPTPKKTKLVAISIQTRTHTYYNSHDIFPSRKCNCLATSQSANSCKQEGANT